MVVGSTLPDDTSKPELFLHEYSYNVNLGVASKSGAYSMELLINTPF